MKRHPLLALALVVACLVGTSAFGATIKVPSPEYPTIQAGIDAASVGDTVLVADGTYRGEGNRNLSFKGKTITVKSENGPQNCGIDCENKGAAFSVLELVVLESVISGFAITNALGYGIFCNGGCALTVTDCIVSGNLGATGIFINGASSPGLTISGCSISGNSKGILVNAASGSTVISDCSIIDNTDFGIFLVSPTTSAITGCTIRRNTLGNIYLGSGYPTIYACTITENTGSGGMLINGSYPTITNSIISNNDAPSGGGIAFSSSFPTITNCTISNNNTIGRGGIYCNNSHMTITNSILWGNTPDQIDLFSGSADVTYSDIQGGYPGDGNLDLNPLFVGSGDYHLTASSPCIDAGTSAGAPDHDIDGDSRPQGSGYDMGADEYYTGVEPQLVADFNASPTSGTAPLTVDFTDKSTGGITSWAWNFGDGATSTQQSPTHTYTDPGTYTVSLTVTGPAGSDTGTKNNYISVTADQSDTDGTGGGGGGGGGCFIGTAGQDSLKRAATALLCALGGAVLLLATRLRRAL